MASSPPSLDNPSSIPEAEARTSDFIEGKVDGEPVLITDPDLIEQVKAAPASMRSVIIRMASRTQDERNKTQERRETMTPVQRRRDVVKEQISENPIDKEDIYHIHSVLGLCSLPYKRPNEGVSVYKRSYGQMSLVVQSGFLANPYNGEMIEQGLPYGSKARLLMLHICTRALRQQNPLVEIEGSMSEFIRSLGFQVTGGKKGTITLFKEQLNRLSSSRIQIGLWDGWNKAKTLNLSPIESMEVWFPSNPEQKILWPSKVELNQKFYESLQKHALPVNMLALSALSHSALQMDLFLWLSYRLFSLKDSYFLTWDKLKEQFCQSANMRMIDFQRQFKKDLVEIQELFQKGLPVSLSDSGMSLKICNPELLLVPPKNTKKR